MFKNIGILTSNLLYKSTPGHCYTIITDPMYEVILQRSFFKDIERSACIVIRIPFYEDLSAPQERILASLAEARKMDCQVYLIYLANGVQMERFLQFID